MPSGITYAGKPLIFCLSSSVAVDQSKYSPPSGSSQVFILKLVHSNPQSLPKPPYSRVFFLPASLPNFSVFGRTTVTASGLDISTREASSPDPSKT